MIELLKQGIALDHLFFTGMKSSKYRYNMAFLTENHKIKFGFYGCNKWKYTKTFKSDEEALNFVYQDILNDNFADILAGAIKNNVPVKYLGHRVTKIESGKILMEHIPWNSSRSLQKAISNKKDITGLDKFIDDKCCEWHDSDCKFSLSDYLGMTKEEYHKFVTLK